MRSLIRAATLLGAIAPLGCADIIGADFNVKAEVVVDGLDYPKAVFIQDGYLYVTEQGTGAPTGRIIRVPLDGGPKEVFAEGMIGPEQLYYSGGYMYWSGQRPSVHRKAIAGGDVEAMTDEPSSSYGIVVLGDSGYFTFGQAIGTFSVSHPGGPAKMLTNSLLNPALMVSDGKMLYVSEYADDHGVGQVDPKSGAVNHVVTGYNHTAGIGIFGQSVYFAGVQNGRGTIGGLNLTNLSSFTLGGAGGDPAALATDGTFVYWASYGEGTIYKIALGGGNAVVVAKDQISPNGLTVDDTYVYWAELKANGTVRRRKK